MCAYQWENLQSVKASKKINKFSTDLGIKVLSRKGRKCEVEIKIYSGNIDKEIFLVGKFNNWGKSLSGEFKFENNGVYSTLKTTLDNKAEYLIKVGEDFVRDPSTVFFSDEGNSIFWDFENDSTYKFKHKSPIQSSRTTKILQTDLPGLIYHFRSKKGVLGSEEQVNNFYNFISDSGVIEKIKDLGFNTIQFLPVSQSIDGDKWSYRYLVPYIFAINKKWGNPDDFRRMVDTFHKHDISVILDLVVSHAPHKDYKIFNINGKDIGINKWDDVFKSVKYLGEETYWGTKRYNYSDEQIRNFITDSAIHYLKNYKVDGFRIDNIDGVLREGVNGDGKEKKFGRVFLREFNQKIYSYKPDAIVNFESHYFHGNNAKWLVQDMNEHPKALGATSYTSSRLTYFFHSEYMPKSADDISPWTIKHIIDEKEWGESNSTIADFHNHDAAAGLMSGRATGSYAYDAMILKKPELHQHAVGKIKVMEAIISFACEGRTLDLLQTFLLQTGTFEHDSTIKWYLELIESNKSVLNYKKEINQLIDSEAFWPESTKYRKIINLDEKSKTIVIERTNKDQSERYLILINMSSFMQFDFIVPAPKKVKYNLVLNSDAFDYSGLGITSFEEEFSTVKTNEFEFFDYGISIPTLPPYGVLVWKF